MLLTREFIQLSGLLQLRHPLFQLIAQVGQRTAGLMNLIARLLRGILLFHGFVCQRHAPGLACGLVDVADDLLQLPLFRLRQSGQW